MMSLKSFNFKSIRFLKLVITVFLIIVLSFITYFIYNLNEQNKQNINTINDMQGEIKTLQTQLENQKITLERTIESKDKEISEVKQTLTNKEEQIQNQENEIEELKKKLVSKLEEEQKQEEEAQRYVVSRGNTDNSEYLGNFTISFYTPYDSGCTGITATGTVATPNRTVAVDPRVIPLGTKLYIEGLGEVIAEDTGGAIVGNRLDFCVGSTSEAFANGVKNLDIWVIK